MLAVHNYESGQNDQKNVREVKFGHNMRKPPLEVGRSNQKHRLIGNMKMLRMPQKLYHRSVEYWKGH